MKITQEILDSLGFTKEETTDGYTEYYSFEEEPIFLTDPKLSVFRMDFNEETFDYDYTSLNTVSDLIAFLEKQAQSQIEKCNHFQDLANEASNNVISLNVKITQLRAIEAGIDPLEFNHKY